MLKYKIIFSLIILCFTSSLVAQNVRDTLILKDNWSFIIDDKNEGITKQFFKKFPQTSTNVKIPHTWNVDSRFENHYGNAWYRKEVFIPQKLENQKVELEIGAANHSCIVYLNGNRVFENFGNGYNKLKINISKFLKFGKTNDLVIYCNNDFRNEKVPYGNSFDWPNDGGLIRPVKLIISNINSAEYAHATPIVLLPNGFVNSSDKILLQTEKCKLGLELGFENIAYNNINIEIQISEENQKTNNRIYNDNFNVDIIGNKANFDIFLKDINLWHFDFPNLYKVKLILKHKGKIIDEITIIIGFKLLNFKDNKFYLNGESIKVMGVEWTAGSHPDFGLAETDGEILRYARLMKDVNCIFSRVHFQQSDLFYDFCDRNGILIQEEIPLWGWAPANDTVSKIASKHLDMMIKNHFNHTSIMAWGIGNELDGRDSSINLMITNLVAQARNLDPNRFVTYMSNSLTKSYRSSKGFVEDVATLGDYIMMNEYGGSWWNISLGEITYHLDSIHNTYPNMPFFISEFGLCEPIHKGGDKRRIHDMVYHHALYESKPWVLGAIYFDLTDYRTHFGKGEGRFKQRVHGIYDAYGEPKPSMETLREISSPIEILQLNKWQEDSLHVEIRGNIGIPQHKVSGYKLYFSENDNNSNALVYDIPDLEPGENAYIKVKNLYNDKGVVTITRPNGYMTIQKRY